MTRTLAAMVLCLLFVKHRARAEGFVAQPLAVLVTTVACLWSLARDRSNALLGAVAGFQVLLVLAGLRSWAIDGGSWRGSLRTPFFEVSQVLCVLLFVAAVVAHRRQPS